MAADRHPETELRVLLLAPTRRDAEVTQALLVKASLACVICPDLAALRREVEAGAGAILTTEEALADKEIGALLAALDKQPPWSDLPVVLLIRGGVQSPVATRIIKALRNVTLLERPTSTRSLTSAVQAAVRGRERQYEVRAQIDAVREAQARTRETQERFQVMANAIPQLAWMAEADGAIYWYNQRWHDYCGTTPEQMKGWKWQSVHDPAELPRVLAGWRAALATGAPWEDTFPLRRHDGEFRWHLSRAMPLRDAAGQVVLWFGTNTDVTDERRKAQERERLLEAERAARAETERAGRMKDEFLANLSHELRTPLNAILGWTMLLRSGDFGLAALGDEVAEGLAVIERNARVQAQIIEDLLDMSRIISGKVHLEVRRLDLGAVIGAAIETVRPAAAAKGIVLQPALDAAAPEVFGDAHRLQQVFWNLLSNAVKFTGRGGRVDVRLERRESALEVSVSDSGEGIPPEFLPYVFDRFRQADASTTRQHGGLGLGLAIVKQLVELHGGTVRVSSAGPGQGTIFTVALPPGQPLAEPEPAAGHGPARRAGPSNGLAELRLNLAGVAVLVVDDEEDARMLVRQLLESRNATVRTAGSAAEALASIRSERPDVLVSDIGMPEEDGYALIRRVRAAESGADTMLPAVALTAYARAEDRAKAVQAGFQRHVTKPVEPAELLAMVASLAGRAA